MIFPHCFLIFLFSDEEIAAAAHRDMLKQDPEVFKDPEFEEAFQKMFIGWGRGVVFSFF
jgi:hypothetical protein